MFIPLAVVSLLGLPALLFPSTALRLASNLASGDREPVLIIGGIITGLAIHLLLRRTNTYRFLSTHQHETAHLVFSILLFSTPHVFVSSSDNGGKYQGERPGGLMGPTRRFLISIAPYWFSPLVFVPLVILALSPPRQNHFRFLLTSLIGLALVLPVAQISRKQPDLKEHGVLPSLVASIWLWAAQAVLLIEMIRVRSLGVTVELYEMAWRIVIPG